MGNQYPFSPGPLALNFAVLTRDGSDVALITVSTRASLKKYHTYNLVIGQGESGDSWEFERIGTEREKMQMEKELQDLRERLAQVDELKKRRAVIENELASVWTEGGETLEAPAFATEGETEPEQQQQQRQQLEGEQQEAGDGVKVEAA